MTYPNTNANRNSQSKAATTAKLGYAAVASASDKATKNPFASFWLASNLVGLSLALLPVPYAGYGASAALAGANVGFAATATSKRRIEAAEKAGELNRSKFEREQARLAEDQTASAKAQNAINAKMSELLAKEQALNVRSETMRDRLTAETTRKVMADAQAKVDAMQERLNAALQDKAAMQATYSEKQSESAKKTGLIVSKVVKEKNDLGDCAAKALSTSNKVLADERKQVNGEIEKLAREIKAMASDLASQKQLVAKLQAPKQFTQKTFEHNVANTIQAFLARRGVVVGCVDLGDISYGLTPIYFEPINCDLAQFTPELLQAVQLHLSLESAPTAEIEHGRIKFTVQLSADKTAAPAKKVMVKDVPLSRLEKAISDAIQVRIAAPSGSGKSVLLGNITNYLTQTFLSTYELYDPKVTDRKVWGNLTPTYYSTDCLPALFNLAGECINRIDLCKQAAENDKPAPKFKPQFHIIDELEFMYGLVDIMDDKAYTPKKFATNVKIGLKVGREHKIKLLFVTQSALCSDVNLKKNDFFNTTSLFLGQTILEALDSDLMGAVSVQKKASLKAEYRSRLDRGDKYTILVYEPENPTTAFFCNAPAPGYYSVQNGENENPDLGGSVLRANSVRSDRTTNATQGVAVRTAERTSEQESVQITQGERVQNTHLHAGGNCPKCGHHSTKFITTKPNTKGNVRMKCANEKCDRKTFSHKAV